MPYLILVRHGESEWNALGKWAGLTDIPLTNAGKLEAKRAAEGLRDITLHTAHVSRLKRAQQTWEEFKKALQLSGIPITQHTALNERDYGNMTGLVKREAKQRLGEAHYRKVSRGWDVAAPGGESLKMVHDRVLEYYKAHILQDLRTGKNVIVVSHHNPLRALVKYLENIPDDAVSGIEMGTSGLYIYRLDDQGNVISKQVRGGNNSYLH